MNRIRCIAGIYLILNNMSVYTDVAYLFVDDVSGGGKLAAGNARPVRVPLPLVVVHHPTIVDAGILWGG